MRVEAIAPDDAIKDNKDGSDETRMLMPGAAASVSPNLQRNILSVARGFSPYRFRRIEPDAASIPKYLRLATARSTEPSAVRSAALVAGTVPIIHYAYPADGLSELR
jgi:hypothetical protein